MHRMSRTWILRATPEARRLILLGTVGLAACAGGGGTAPPAPGAASDAQWRQLATPRPTPLQGAPRIALSGVELTSVPSWGFASPVPLGLGVTELVAAGLLRRADVHFVERRRFAAAADAERAGRARPPAAPPVGTSAGAELVATVVVAPLNDQQTSVEVRLADAATGAVRATTRRLVPSDVDAVALARQAVTGILGAVSTLGRLPSWNDPSPSAAPSSYVASGIAAVAVESFFTGLAAEEAWAWERARVAYQAAAESGGFVEAEAALARTARLRNGGTLGES
jgi:hypothetical protein